MKGKIKYEQTQQSKIEKQNCEQKGRKRKGKKKGNEMK